MEPGAPAAAPVSWHMVLPGSELQALRVLAPDRMALLFSAACVRPLPAPLGQGDTTAFVSGVSWLLDGVKVAGVVDEAPSDEAFLGRLQEGSELIFAGQRQLTLPLPAPQGPKPLEAVWTLPVCLNLALARGERWQVSASVLRVRLASPLAPRGSLAC